MRGVSFRGNGDDEIYHYTRDAWLDGGNGNDLIVGWDGATTDETVTMFGGNGDDVLESQDATSIVQMDGGRGSDACTGASTCNCEG